MSKSSVRTAIRLRGVRHNNLKNFDLDLPLKQLIVITGLSGSGKSSLAFDTLFAEGQRRYIETFSPYARQFFDRMDKPQVDSIEGIPPAIAIEQRNAVKTTRSTVGTMTEICDHMKVLWPHLAQLHCRQCGKPVRKDSPQEIWKIVLAPPSRSNQPTQIEDEERGRSGVKEALITFNVPLSEKLSLAESLGLISKQGYQRVLHNGKIVRLEDVPHSAGSSPQSAITVIQDRLKLSATNRARFVEACEQAYHFGKGQLTIHTVASDSSLPPSSPPQKFSNRFHCANCDIEYREPSPALFSFNHPVGACPTCKGFGRVISIDYNLAVPDRSRTIAEGVVKPWLTGQGAESQTDLMKACRHFEIPTDVPFEQLPGKWQDFVINGEPGYGKNEEHEWPRAWYGVKGYFRWLESKSYKMHVRVLLSRYRAYTKCPDCEGARLKPEALLYLLPVGDDVRSLNSDSPGLAKEGKMETPDVVSCQRVSLPDFYALPIRDTLALVDQLAARRSSKARPRSQDPIHHALTEVRSRLQFLNDVGLSYLTLDRATRSLSGGETERVNLTTCLGTRLVNTLFVLDEPSVGLHPRDTDRLIHILQQLRNAGNTVVVVEHEASVMRSADQIIDIGPGHGATGGHIVFQGPFSAILNSKDSLTGKYLSGRQQIEIPPRRAVSTGSGSGTPFYARARSEVSVTALLNDAPLPFRTQTLAPPLLKITHATRHNLKDVSVEIPLERFVAVTGVSGSGKTTLMREVLLPALEARLRSQLALLKHSGAKASERFEDPDTAAEAGDSESSGDSPSQGMHCATLEGTEHLDRVILVDQAILGKTPRSNPAVYIGAFDDVREVFAQSEPARQRGLNASAFSFNSAQGQCERCRGAGFEKIEMQFLSDVFIRCPDCNGRRYRPHILEVKITGAVDQVSDSRTSRNQKRPAAAAPSAWSIADTLEATADEVIDFLRRFPESKPAQRAISSLGLLQEVGLGYLKLGQPINTLSGGESQRLKLVRHLAEASLECGDESPLSAGDLPPSNAVAQSSSATRTTKTIPRAAERGTALLTSQQSNKSGDASPHSKARRSRPTLFLFDEPTTGLHFEDVRILLKVFQRLVNAGHSVIVIEHNLDVIKSADWVIDLGPDAGDEGGKVVAQGTPEDVAECSESHTGRFLRDALGKRSNGRAPTKLNQPRTVR